MKLCLNCQENPIAKGKVKYCSDYCQNRANNKQKLQQKKVKMKGRYCANPECKKYFTTNKSNKFYCCDPCRQRKSKLKNKEYKQRNSGVQPCSNCGKTFYRRVGGPKKCPECRNGNQKEVALVDLDLPLSNPDYFVGLPGAKDFPELVCPFR